MSCTPELWMALLEGLLWKKYKPSIIDAAISRAKAIPRLEALKRVERPKTTKRPVFVVRFDRRLPSVTKITRRHWRTMVADPYLASVFPQPPLIAYTRPQTIRDKLIRAKVPPANSRPKREIPGMHKCNQHCPICPYVQTGKSINWSTNSIAKRFCQNIIFSSVNISGQALDHD